MSSYDLVNQFDQDWKDLTEAWERAFAIKYTNAESALRLGLSQFGGRDPISQAMPSKIAQVRAALGELRRIQEQMVARLDAFEHAIIGR